MKAIKENSSLVGFVQWQKFLLQVILLGNFGLATACGYVHVDVVSTDPDDGIDNSYPPSATPITGPRQQIVVASAGSSISVSPTIQMKARLQFTDGQSKQLGNGGISASVGSSTGGVR